MLQGKSIPDQSEVSLLAISVLTEHTTSTSFAIMLYLWC